MSFNIENLSLTEEKSPVQKPTLNPNDIIRLYLNNNYKYENSELSFKFPTTDVLEMFKKTINQIVSLTNDTTIVFKGSNIIDVLGFFYPVGFNCLQDPLYKILYNIRKPDPTQFQNVVQELPYLVWFKNDVNAVVPKKAHYSDAGYDLTIIKKIKDLGENIAQYDTGISLQIPLGFYVEIHPRSSLSKSGYILSNLTGIIDVSYTGNLLICLTRVDKSISEFKLPFTCCQMILKKCEYSHFVEGEREFVVETARGVKGFGSSDEKKE
jgi:deoxyuridine 5'-triphosphate nucleotidohydrolase